MTTVLSDGRVLSPLVTDEHWRAIRAYRESHCVCPMTPEHWKAVNLCDRALRDYSDHEAWTAVTDAIERSKP